MLYFCNFRSCVWFSNHSQIFLSWSICFLEVHEKTYSTLRQVEIFSTFEHLLISSGAIKNQIVEVLKPENIVLHHFRDFLTQDSINNVNSYFSNPGNQIQFLVQEFSEENPSFIIEIPYSCTFLQLKILSQILQLSYDSLKNSFEFLLLQHRIPFVLFFQLLLLWYSR